MPRPGPRRTAVTVKLSEQGVAHIDRVAANVGVTRSEMIRRMLAYAAKEMPEAWNAWRLREPG